jgi:hypothetical protein
MTGTGKSFLACALAHQACRKGYRVLYRRASRLFHELTSIEPFRALPRPTLAGSASMSLGNTQGHDDPANRA